MTVIVRRTIRDLRPILIVKGVHGGRLFENLLIQRAVNGHRAEQLAAHSGRNADEVTAFAAVDPDSWQRENAALDIHRHALTGAER